MESLFDDEQAKRRYQEYKSKDPFPQIEPALLNSAHIEDYVKTTGMISPFYPEKLKSASYEVGLEGEIYFWEGEGDPNIIDLDKDEEFILEENSIAFVSLKTKFRIPDYIALRFNLTITNVHRGILLGTGPLVDPGFEGNLLIPLHNLTTNKYKFTRGEGLIWIEFTKLSKIPDLPQEENTLTGKYREFPQEKKKRDFKYYLSEAAWGRSIRSSIQDAVIESAKSAKHSEDAAMKTKRFITIGGIVAFAIFAIPFLYSLYQGYVQIGQLSEQTNVLIKDTSKEFNALTNQFISKASLWYNRRHEKN